MTEPDDDTLPIAIPADVLARFREDFDEPSTTPATPDAMHSSAPPTLKGPHPMSIILLPCNDPSVTDDEIRDAVCGLVEQLAGLSADPKTRDAYNSVIAPDEIEGKGSALQTAMDHMWSCALTTDGEDRILFDAGEISPEAKAKAIFLWRAYVNGAAMVDEQRVALAFGGIHYARDLSPTCRPGRATHQIIDVAGVAHTYTQTSDADPATGVFRTVEGGGQDARGFMAINAGSRVLLADGTVTNAARTAHHKLGIWIDMVAELRGAGVKIPVLRDTDTPNAGGESAPTGAATRGEIPPAASE